MRLINRFLNWLLPTPTETYCQKCDGLERHDAKSGQCLACEFMERAW